MDLTNKIFYANLFMSETHTFMVNDTVEIIDLKSGLHWNGKLAIIQQSFVKSKGRWLIQLNGCSTQALIKTENSFRTMMSVQCKHIYYIDSYVFDLNIHLHVKDNLWVFNFMYNTMTPLNTTQKDFDCTIIVMVR